MNNYYQKFKTLINNPKYKSLWNVFLFMLITYVFHKLWWTFSSEIKSLAFISNSADYLAHQVFLWSKWFNANILSLEFTTKDPNTFLFPQVNGYIAVEESCSGLKQMYQLFFLFLLFPGPWKHKLWYIPITFFVMFLTNVFRIIVLSIILINWPDQWHFCHDWILRPFFYVVIFGLWVLWVEFFVNPPQQRSKWLRKLNFFTKS